MKHADPRKEPVCQADKTFPVEERFLATPLQRLQPAPSDFFEEPPQAWIVAREGGRHLGGGLVYYPRRRPCLPYFLRKKWEPFAVGAIIGSFCGYHACRDSKLPLTSCRTGPQWHRSSEIPVQTRRNSYGR